MMMLRFLTLLTLLMSAISAEARCFNRHLEEAIAINKERKPLYSALTQGKSLKISHSLISVENAILLYTKSFGKYDEDAEIYERNGIPLICDAVVEMSETPDFAENFPEGKPQLRQRRKVVLGPILKNLRQAHEKKDFKTIYDTAKAQVEFLQQEPRYSCLVRHGFESIARMAAQAESFAKKAADKGLPDPKYISLRMLKGHINVLSMFASIDNMAAPLQSQGIPILCRDVPHISIPDYGQN